MFLRSIPFIWPFLFSFRWTLSSRYLSGFDALRSYFVCFTLPLLLLCSMLAWAWAWEMIVCFVALRAIHTCHRHISIPILSMHSQLTFLTLVSSLLLFRLICPPSPSPILSILTPIPIPILPFHPPFPLLLNIPTRQALALAPASMPMLCCAFLDFVLRFWSSYMPVWIISLIWCFGLGY